MFQSARTLARPVLGLLLSTAIAVPGVASAASAPTHGRPLVTLQPDPTADVAPYVSKSQEPAVSRAEMIKRLRANVKYVFVIFNENHSFDNEYGTLPGVNGQFSDGMKPRPADQTPGFYQSFTKPDGTKVQVHPFRLGPKQNSNVIDSVDHSHTGLAAKLDVVNGTPKMDGFAKDEFNRFAKRGGTANIKKGAQFAHLVMSYVNCNTIPFFWKYASRFTIFDNMFATENSPSAPNAIAMLAGQAGATQWVEHGAKGPKMTVGKHQGTLHGVPLVNDSQPFYGSQFATTQNHLPSAPNQDYSDNNITENLTFASVPLTLTGGSIKGAMAKDHNPGKDLADIGQDIPYIAGKDQPSVAWTWYQSGYDHEPTDPGSKATHDNYISHHNGAQYFGYIADDPAMNKHLRGLGDFFSDVHAGRLPKKGGVFYIRGGFHNLQGMKPAITNPNTPPAEVKAIDRTKTGDDDHPGYSDRQISEAMDARAINAIASHPSIWAHSAIIITYDESDGEYDHVPPRILAYGPDGLPLSRGVRVPMLVISPFARAHAVSHAEGDHNAVIETINDIFNRPALASLPDEARALVKGRGPAFATGPAGFVQNYLGPRDINSPITDDLLSAFDPERLSGKKPKLPASLAMIDKSQLTKTPPFDGKGCKAIGITPEDIRQGIDNKVPAGFNPLPSTWPKGN